MELGIYRSADLGADINGWLKEQDDWLAKRPVCDDCDHHIQDDHYFEINGNIICPDCIEAYRKEVDDGEFI